MRHITIFRDEKLYVSHASACVAANGDVLVVFRQSPREHIFAHVHPQSKIDIIRSTDMGETWNPHSRTTICDPGDEINVSDPSITSLRDGTLVFTAINSYAPWTNVNEWGDRIIAVRGTNYFFVPTEHWITVRRSFDHGLTWDGPYTVTGVPYDGRDAIVYASLVELDDDRLLMPLNSIEYEESRRHAVIMCSSDRGKSWEPYSKITSWRNDNCALSFGLPSIVAYDDLHMLAAGWSNQGIGTAITDSMDAGKTWSPLRKVVSNGECMNLCVTRRGTTLLTYGYRRSPYGIRIWPSYDKGKTWQPDHAAALRADGAMRDLGFPRTIQLPDGRLLCTYYFNVRDADKSYYNEEESRNICRTWKLNPALFTYETAGLRFIGATIFDEEELSELAGTATFDPQVCEAGPTLL